MTPSKTIGGSCLCGAIAFALTPPTDFCAHCHCRSCRKATGAAFVTWTSVNASRFVFTKGESAVQWHKSSDAIQWGFCRDCGSTLVYKAAINARSDGARSETMYITVGSLDEPLDRTPDRHVSFEEHVTWFEPGDGLPTHIAKTDELFALSGTESTE